MKFDIILPTTGIGTVFDAIRSVNEQTYTDWRLFVMCDGIKELFWPYTDGRFCLPKQGKVYGSQLPPHCDSGAWARNEGVRVSGEGRDAGDWIAYIDDDDLWRPDHLKTIVRLAKDNPEATMIRTSGQSFKRSRKSPRSKQIVNKPGVINTTDILTVGMAHRRDLFEQTPGWQPCDNHDHILWSDLMLAGGSLVEDESITFDFQR